MGSRLDFLVRVFSLRLPPPATFHLSEAIALAEARLEHRDPGTRQATSRMQMRTAAGVAIRSKNIADAQPGQEQPGRRALSESTRR